MAIESDSDEYIFIDTAYLQKNLKGRLSRHTQLN